MKDVSASMRRAVLNALSEGALVCTTVAKRIDRSPSSVSLVLRELVADQQVFIIGIAKGHGSARANIYSLHRRATDASDTNRYLEPWQRAARARFEQYGKL